MDKEVRTKLIKSLTNELPVLRAKLGISQEELAAKIGVSRQTINAIEGKKRDMSWGMFLSIVFFFDFNEQTAGILKMIGICTSELNDQLSVPIEDEEE
ncbi:helix-turn-helix transcriptional regulator [Lactococcus hodotermopsidis]|nr:helix-turn-helix domain-containing protein [Lactococcus hodotermopsidis]